MQEYMKLLCVNKIRESKRLIKNMFLPIVSMLIVAGFAGYQMMINIFLVIWRKNAFHARICYLVAGILILYSFYVCFINRKPEIVIKPASLFFIEMRKIRHMILIKYMGLTLKHLIFSFFLSGCINGMYWNKNFLFIVLFLFLLLNTTTLIRWKRYHRTQRVKDGGIWLLFSIILAMSLKYSFLCMLNIAIWMFLLFYDFCVLEIDVLKYEEEMQFAEKVRIAQNFHNTVLLDQYAKEKLVRYLPKKIKCLNHYSNFRCSGKFKHLFID